MHRSIAMFVAAFLSCSAMAADNPTSTSDVSGGWRLHPQGSQFLNPANAPKDIIWSILIDGNQFRWNRVIIPQSGPPTFESYANDVGATPAAVTGSPHAASSSVTLGNGAFTTTTMPSLGGIKQTSSTCTLSADKKQLDCKGTVTKTDGTTQQFEVLFDRM